MDDDPFVSPDGAKVTRPPVPRILAALRPPMLRLARKGLSGRTRSSSPSSTRVVHATSSGRRRCSSSSRRWCSPAIRWMPAGEPVGRSPGTLDTPNYLDNLRWLGFAEADVARGGSDALVDALIVAGDEETIAARCDAHLDAGASQVAVQPLEEGDPFGRETLRRLASVLLDPRE
jgi:hypothetical protein